MLQGSKQVSAWAREELAGCEVVYRDKETFERTLRAIVSDGQDKLHVISDFDFTLTRYYQADGISRSASCHMVLESSTGLLPEAYTVSAKALQHKYHPIEADMTMDPEVKFRHMEDWVNAHNKLFMESGVTQHIIVTAVDRSLSSGRFRMREGAYDLLSTLERHGIPLLIFSAGISNVLECAIERTFSSNSTSTSSSSGSVGAVSAALPSNISVISNRCLFDSADGSLQGFSAPVLHVYNKSCHAFLSSNPHFERIRGRKASDEEEEDAETAGALATAHDDGSCRPQQQRQRQLPERRNVFLFGDSLGDIKMSQGLEDRIDNIIKIAFLNDRDRAAGQLDSYLQAGNFDLVVYGDESLNVHRLLLSMVLSK
jgi:HAD superfamily hydrolase (TIGR01544 family)